jgi:lysosomal Pro-X carboxypeptidase
VLIQLLLPPWSACVGLCRRDVVRAMCRFMPMGRSGTEDMFWLEAWNETAARAACKASWNVEPREAWPTIEWAGRDLGALSNVVFSNGLYDPWHGGGVLQNLSDTVTAVIIPEGGHHLDLMFSTDDDPMSVRQARLHQLEQIAKWVEEFQSHRS